MSDRRFGERIGPTDVDGLIDPATGKITTTLVNVTSLAEYSGTGNQAAMLASGAGVLDWFVRSDLSNQIWACIALPSSSVGNWTSTAALTSSAPAALGVAAVGTSNSAARGDHVHAMPSAGDVGAATSAQGATADAAIPKATGTAADQVLTFSASATPAATQLTANTALAKRGAGVVANPIGVAAGTDLLDRDGGDGRYDATGAASTVAGNLTSHLNDAADAHAASAITVTPTGNLAATTGQAAVIELQGDIDTINGKLGAASGIATLDSSSLVVQNPANATTTAATAKIPIALTGGQLKAEWLATGTPTSGYMPVAAGAGVAPAWTDVVPVSSGGTGGTTGIALAYTVATADVAMTATTGAALDCTSSALVTTLPPSPTASMLAGVMRYAGTAKNRSYVRPSSTGKLIASQQLISLANQGERTEFQWIDSTLGWGMSRVDAIELTCPIPSGTQFIMLPGATWTANEAKDHSGNGYNATEATNPPTINPTGINSGPAWDADGTNDVLVANAAILNTTGTWFVAFTFIADDVTTIQSIISKQDLSGSVENSMTIQLNGGALYAYAIDEASAGASIGKQSSAVSIGTKYTVVVTYDGGSDTTTSLLMYLNNVAQATTSNAGVFASVTSAAGAFRLFHRIAAGGAGERFYNGKLNWCIAGTGTPTAAQISAFYTFGNSL